MSMLPLLLVVWPISEIALGVIRRASPRSAEVRDRGSAALLWLVIVVSVAAATWLQFQAWGRIDITPSRLRLLALVFVIAGLTVRWAAILTLGRLFTTTVAVHEDHHVVRRGLYSRIRHPSYSGLMLAFIGLGLSFGHWLSLAVVVVPVSGALWYRIVVEERALAEMLGKEYLEYMAVTKRLVPWVY